MTELIAAEYFIEDTDGPTATVKFRGRAFLKDKSNILQLLQTSLVLVTANEFDETTFQYAPRPNSAEAIPLIALLNGNRKVKPFVHPNESTLRFEVWLEAEGDKTQRIRTDSKNCLLPIKVTNTLTVPMRVTFTDNPEHSFDISLERDVERFKTEQRIISDALFPPDTMQRTFNKTMMANAKLTLTQRTDAADLKRQELAKEVKARPTNEAQQLLAAATKEHEGYLAAQKDLDALSEYYNKIQDPKTSSKYRLHYEISSKAEEHYIVLVSTVGEAFK